MQTSRLVPLPPLPAGALLGVLACTLLGLFPTHRGYARQSLPTGRQAVGTPVILISVDTLRADRLGCYGYPKLSTPHIDALARGGTLFTRVNSNVPLTLPSHTTMLTSRLPFSHGVEDNGGTVPAGTVSLAGLLKNQGYRTAAFVGGFVLDRRFGLNQGFDVYDSPFNLRRQRRDDPGDVKRLGEEVVQAATNWVQTNAQVPFFLFLHLYDLHAPYELPSSSPLPLSHFGYEKALVYEDSILGQFWSSLGKLGLQDQALVIFTSDHGESLGEHQESAHGYFIYQSTLHVPLIIRWPKGTMGTAARVEEPASLLDIAPTVLRALGLSIPAEFQGNPLQELMRSKPAGGSREIYAESLYARNHFGCTALRSLRLGRYKYIEAPAPEFYDLNTDPAERLNLYSQQTATVSFYRERLAALKKRYPADRDLKNPLPNQEVAAALQSLGYLTAGRAGLPKVEPTADPKARILDFEENRRALDMAAAGRSLEAINLLDKLSRKYPDVPDLRVSLAVHQQRQGKREEAIASFKQVLKQDPLNARAHFNLANAYYESRQLDLAMGELEATLAIVPQYGRAAEMLGAILLQKGNLAQARSHYQRMLKSDPANYLANYQLGILASQSGRWAEAERFLKMAGQADEKSAECRNALGVVYLMTSRLPEAQAALEDALRLESQWADIHFNLGLLYRQQGKPEAAGREFRSTLALDPNFDRARQALASPEFQKK